MSLTDAVARARRNAQQEQSVTATLAGIQSNKVVTRGRPQSPVGNSVRQRPRSKSQHRKPKSTSHSHVGHMPPAPRKPFEPCTIDECTGDRNTHSSAVCYDHPTKGEVN